MLYYVKYVYVYLVKYSSISKSLIDVIRLGIYIRNNLLIYIYIISNVSNLVYKFITIFRMIIKKKLNLSMCKKKFIYTYIRVYIRLKIFKQLIKNINIMPVLCSIYYYIRMKLLYY